MAYTITLPRNILRRSLSIKNMTEPWREWLHLRIRIFVEPKRQAFHHENLSLARNFFVLVRSRMRNRSKPQSVAQQGRLSSVATRISGSTQRTCWMTIKPQKLAHNSLKSLSTSSSLPPIRTRPRNSQNLPGCLSLKHQRPNLTLRKFPWMKLGKL